MSGAAVSRPMREETAPVSGQLVEAAPGAYLLRFPLPPSLPIPLHVASPEGVRLVTWALAGLDADAADGPVCLLALEADGAALRGGVSVATHFRDLALRPEPAPADALSAAERALLARALLSAGTSGLGTLGALFGLVERSVAALPVADDAPDLADEAGGWSLGGTAIPLGLLFRTGAGWGCARVTRSALRFAGHPRQHLTLEPVWGAAPAGLPERSFALYAHGFTALTTRTS
ncbi:hypothetical protein MPPM_0857 [Methylorubrum populi]|uniref:Uncharacterized protein n=2 Tax=Methylorubrum populi TaxID=223967 RepID=A0A161JLN2_9HYPH|nr:hypothetical protein MPPM_0857 [Methylorubrum populi]